MFLPAFIPALFPKKVGRMEVADQGTLNAYREPLDFELPKLRDGRENWRRWIDTALDPPHEICEWNAEQPVLGTTYRVGARSVVVLIAGERRMPGISTGVQSAAAGSPRNGRTVLPPEDSIARSLDIVRHP